MIKLNLYKIGYSEDDRKPFSSPEAAKPGLTPGKITTPGLEVPIVTCTYINRQPFYTNIINNKFVAEKARSSERFDKQAEASGR